MQQWIHPTWPQSSASARFCECLWHMQKLNGEGESRSLVVPCPSCSHLGTVRAKRHWLLCQLPTTPGQGWPVGSFLPVQGHRYGQCDVQVCCPRELCSGVSPWCLNLLVLLQLCCIQPPASFSSASGVAQASLLLPCPRIAVCEY